MPLLLVFHTPPEPAAMYQVLASVALTAIWAIRPPISAGPMLRKERSSTAWAIAS